MLSRWKALRWWIDKEWRLLTILLNHTPKHRYHVKYQTCQSIRCIAIIISILKLANIGQILGRNLCIFILHLLYRNERYLQTFVHARLSCKHFWTRGSCFYDRWWKTFEKEHFEAILTQATNKHLKPSSCYSLSTQAWKILPFCLMSALVTSSVHQSSK